MSTAKLLRNKIRRQTTGVKNASTFQPAGKGDKTLVAKGLENFYAKRPHLKPQGRWSRRSNSGIFENENYE